MGEVSRGFFITHAFWQTSSTVSFQGKLLKGARNQGEWWREGFPSNLKNRFVFCFDVRSSSLMACLIAASVGWSRVHNVSTREALYFLIMVKLWRTTNADITPQARWEETLRSMRQLKQDLTISKVLYIVTLRLLSATLTRLWGGVCGSG